MDQLARYFHLDDADRELVMAKRWDHTRLGFAVQLGTVRFLGTFLDDLAGVPAGVLADLARQLGIGNPDCLTVYREGRARWQHAREIRSGSVIANSLTRSCVFVLRDGYMPCVGPAPTGRAYYSIEQRRGWYPKKCCCQVPLPLSGWWRGFVTGPRADCGVHCPVTSRRAARTGDGRRAEGLSGELIAPNASAHSLPIPPRASGANAHSDGAERGCGDFFLHRWSPPPRHGPKR